MPVSWWNPMIWFPVYYCVSFQLAQAEATFLKTGNELWTESEPCYERNRYGISYQGLRRKYSRLSNSSSCLLHVYSISVNLPLLANTLSQSSRNEGNKMYVLLLT